MRRRFRVIALDLWGHGRTADREGPVTLESFATDVAELTELVVGGPAPSLAAASGGGKAGGGGAPPGPPTVAPIRRAPAASAE